MDWEHTTLIVAFWVSLVLAGHGYLTYPLSLVFLRQIFPPRPWIRSAEHTPGITVLVAAYNEEKVIRQRLENLLACDYPADRLQVLIASDGSSDGTNRIVAEHADARVTLLELNDRRGKVNALNRAVPHAEGEILVLSDANTHFEPGALRALVRHFADPEVGCVCGALHFVNADGSRMAELEGVYWRFENWLKRREGERGCLLGANGGIFAVRKALWVNCPPNTIVEDFVMPMKILEQGRRVGYDPEAVATEEAAQAVEDEFGRRIRIGAGDFQALMLLWRLLHPARGFAAWAFLSHKVLRWLTPVFLLVLAGANLSLMQDPYYSFALVPQAVFYGLALAGWGADRMGWRFRLLQLPYYFCSMNLALFLGMWRFISGRQSVKWKRTAR